MLATLESSVERANITVARVRVAMEAALKRSNLRLEAPLVNTHGVQERKPVGSWASVTGLVGFVLVEDEVRFLQKEKRSN